LETLITKITACTTAAVKREKRNGEEIMQLSSNIQGMPFLCLKKKEKSSQKKKKAEKSNLISGLQKIKIE